MRVRFAPSPTGHLHIGGARTALFNWLLARRHGGRFVLRIEDTDRARSTEEFEDEILRDLLWLGLPWDEGPNMEGECGPYRQSERTTRYDEIIEQMLADGTAYRCTCSKERLDEVRALATANKQTPRYDRHCRDLHLGPDCGEHVVRLRMPLTGNIHVDDQVKGPVDFDASELDDLVLRRVDGSPIYNLTVVADDHDMEITHVIRGDDHLNNTPKQVAIYNALGWDTPIFGHLPLILGDDGGKMSKRHAATSVGAYREMGILPEALRNYLARLGWSHGDDEVFSTEQLIDVFGLDGVGKAGCKWDMDKLLWLNQTWMKQVSNACLARRSRSFFADQGLATDDRLHAAVKTLRERAKTLSELATSGAFYFVPDEQLAIDEAASRKFLKPAVAGLLSDYADVLQEVAVWTEPQIEAATNAFVEARELKLGKLAQPVRVSITGQPVGPGLYEMLVAIGRESALSRIRSGAALATSQQGA